MPTIAPMSSRLPRRRLLTLGAALLLAPLMERPRLNALAAPQAEWPTPPAAARVGLQVGHWQIEELPED